MDLSTPWNDPKRAEHYYNTVEGLHKEDIDLLRDWINSQEHLPKPSDVFLIYFLHSCYFDIEETKKCLNNIFIYRAQIPEIFDDRNPFREDIQRQLPVVLRTLLPQRTKENYNILFVRILDTNPRHNNATVEYKIIDMMANLQYFQRGICEGQILIIDTSTASFGQLFRINIGLARRYANYLQDAIAVRLKAVHVINVNTFAEKGFLLLKPFLKTHIKEMIHLHSSLETLFEAIPQELLPSELGGNQRSFMDLHNAMVQNLMENADFFTQDDALKADLSLLK